MNNSEIYNIVSSNNTVSEIVDTIRKLVPNLKVELVDSEIMNQLSYEVSCDKFKEKGFIFSGSLRRGIGETISLLRN